MRVGVIGCGGRMGRLILSEILADERVELAAAFVRDGSAWAGKDVGELLGGQPVGLQLTSDAEAFFAASEIVIDFSTPEASLHYAEIAARHGRPLMIGTTGLDEAQKVELAGLAQKIAIVLAPNTSVGVNLLGALIQRVASILDEEFDIEIVEMHHRRKVDAPSGTALFFGEAAAKGRGQALDEVAVRGRDGLTGPRKAGTIGFAALRGGDVVGDHSVYFAGEGERLVLSHLASDRRIYAKGALRAARWLEGRAPGLYAMPDVLGFSPEAGR